MHALVRSCSALLVLSLAAALPLTATGTAEAAEYASVDLRAPSRLTAGVYEPVTSAHVLSASAADGRPFTVSTARLWSDPYVGAVPTKNVSAVLATVRVHAAKPVALRAALTRAALASTVPLVQTTAADPDAELSLVLPVDAASAFVGQLSGGSGTVSVDVHGWFTGGNTRSAGSLVPTTLKPLGSSSAGYVTAPNNGTVRVPVRGRAGVPADATAVLVVAKPVAPTSAGSLTAWSGTGSRPYAQLAYTTSSTTATTVLAPIAPDGFISLYNAGSRTRFSLAVDGWTTDETHAAGSVLPSSAVRVLAPTTVLGNGATTRLDLSGQTLPTDGAAAAVLSVTVSSGKPGTVTLTPNDLPSQPVAQVKYDGRGPSSSLVTVRLGRDGQVLVRNTGGPSRVSADVVGWVQDEPIPLANPVTPPDLARLQLTPSELSNQATAILARSNKRALRTWWPKTAPTLLSEISGTVAQSGQDPVRRLSMQSYALATALATGTYDAGVTGVPRENALKVTLTLIDELARWHGANRPGGFVGGSQGSLWTAFVARAGWMLWDSLTPRTQARVSRMIEREADESTRFEIPRMRDDDGNLLRPGNTGSDEASWYALPLQLAGDVMATSPKAGTWKTTQISLVLHSWARPSDTKDPRVLNGRALGDWLNGSNIEPNGIVVNHDRVAPDYATLTAQTVNGAVFDRLSARPTPEAQLSLLAPVYAANTGVRFSGALYAAPGGTIFQSAKVYYPQGCDWGTGQALPYALTDAQSLLLMGNAAAEPFLRAHLARQKQLMDRFSDGTTFANDSEYLYKGREDHTAQIAADVVLSFVAAGLPGETDLSSY